MSSMLSSSPAPLTNSPAPHTKRTLTGVERRQSLGSNATGLLGRAVQANQAHLMQQQQQGVHSAHHHHNNSAGGFLPPAAGLPAASMAGAAPGSPLRPALAPRQVASSPSRAPLPHHASSSSASAYSLPPHPLHASPSLQPNGFAHAGLGQGAGVGSHAGHAQASFHLPPHASHIPSIGHLGRSASASAPTDFPFPNLVTLNRSRLLHLLEYQIKLSNSKAGADPDSAQHYAVLAAAVRLLHLQGCVHNFSFVTSTVVADELLNRRPSDTQLHYSADRGFTSTSKDGSPASRLTALHLLEVLAEIRNSPSPVLALSSELPPQLLDAAIYYRPDERVDLGSPHAHSLQLSPYVYHRVLALLFFLLNLHLHQLTLARVLHLLQGIERHLSYWSAHQDITTLPKPYRLWQYARWRWANRRGTKQGAAHQGDKTNPYRNWSAMAARNVRELLAIKNLWTTRCGRMAIRMAQIQDFLRDSFAKGASATAPLAPLFHHQIACNSRYFAKLYHYVSQEEMALPVAHDEHVSLYSPSSHAAAAPAVASAASSGATTIEAKILALHSQLAVVDSFLTTFEMHFSRQFNESIAPFHKPHHLFEWWHYYASVVVTLGVGGYLISKNQARVKSLAVDGVGALREFMHEHAWEPLGNIYSTVFTTLRDRSLFSTNAKALVASKENLAQMLGAFAHNHASELSKHENLTLAEYEARIPLRAKEGDMNLVMKTYEREIERPIKSLLIGDLMHGLLIQVQKVKVDAEAACLAADQLLQSNEINFNLTATIPVLMLAYLAADFANKWVLRGSWSSKKVRARVQESKTFLSEIEQLYILHLQSGTMDGNASSSHSHRGSSRPDMYSQLSSLRLEDLAHLSNQEAEAEDEALRMRSPQTPQPGSSSSWAHLDPAAPASASASSAAPSTPRAVSGSGAEIFGRLESSESAFANASSSPQESEDEADEFDDAAEDEAGAMRSPRNGGRGPSSARTLFGPSVSAATSRSSRPACPSALGLNNHAYGTSLVLIFQLSRLLSTLPLSSAFSPASWWGTRRASTDADPRTILHRDLLLLASHQLTPEQKLRWVTQMWRNYEFLKA